MLGWATNILNIYKSFKRINFNHVIILGDFNFPDLALKSYVDGDIQGYSSCFN